MEILQNANSFWPFPKLLNDDMVNNTEENEAAKQLEKHVNGYNWQNLFSVN